MEAVAFETIAQAVGVPAAVALWIWWNARGRTPPVDAGTELVKDMGKVLDKLDDLSRRTTVLEVKLEERTKR